MAIKHSKITSSQFHSLWQNVFMRLGGILRVIFAKVIPKFGHDQRNTSNRNVPLKTLDIYLIC